MRLWVKWFLLESGYCQHGVMPGSWDGGVASTPWIWGRNTLEELQSGMGGHPNSSRLSPTHAEHPRCSSRCFRWTGGVMPGCRWSSSLVQGRSSCGASHGAYKALAFTWELLVLFRVGWRRKNCPLRPLLWGLHVLLLPLAALSPEPRACAQGCQDCRAKVPTAPLPAERHWLHCKHKPGWGWTCCGSASMDVVLETSSCMAALGWKSQVWGRGMDLVVGWDVGNKASLHFQ